MLINRQRREVRKSPIDHPHVPIYMDLFQEKQTEADADSVKRFRKMLFRRNLLVSSQDNYGIMLRFLKNSRFCAKPGYDYDEATRDWERMIKWRKENKVDTIIQDFVYGEYEAVKSIYSEGFHGVDKEGRPIYIRCYEKLDYTQLLKVTTADRFIKYYIQECEKLVVDKFPACSEIAKKPIDSIVGIYFLPPPSSNYKFLGQDYQNKLLKFIDEDQLPTFLGGSCSCPGKNGCLGFNKGPWVKNERDGQ
ncbi:hypothetical protein V2J09_005653 [Rumex salicifolius]